ncbi:MAG: nickel-dependent lactate racemase [Bacillota bacterium]
MYSIIEKAGEIVYRDQVENVELKIAKENFLNLVKFTEPAPLNWPKDARTAFQNPLGCLPLNQIARGAKKVALLVSDSTRGVPTAKVIPLLIKELAAAGVKLDQITAVVAIGVHRPATPEEMAAIIGPEYIGKIKVINHQPYQQDQLRYLGKTSYGTPVEVNKTVYECDLRIAVGKVEPHEFAGFSGGRKSVLPGISSEKTIEINHRPEMLLKPGARPGELHNNPIHLDMVEAAKLLGIDFTVNLVLNSQGEITGVFTGDLIVAHQRAVDFMRSFCEVRLAQQPDIIVTTPGEPLNINFYQSIKPLIALAPVMGKGGILVLYSFCRDGVDSEDMLVPYQGAASIEEVVKNLQAGYKIQMDHSLLLSKILLNDIKIIATSPNVAPEIFEKMFLIPAASPQKALDKALAMAGKPHPQVLFYPQPQRGLTVKAGSKC